MKYIVIALFFITNAHAGKVVSVAGIDCCRYTVDGITQTKYCTSSGVTCNSDGSCSASIAGRTYTGTKISLKAVNETQKN